MGRRCIWFAVALATASCTGSPGGRRGGAGAITTAGLPTTAGTDAAGSETEATEGSPGSGGGGGGGTDNPKFDLGDSPAGGSGACGNDKAFSFIWIANTAEGTVSKIDTETGVEAGRYATGPQSPSGSPSRTAVNQFGDAVVVNRHPGGITMIAALPERCVDTSGDGVIQTSTGPGLVLPWGADECVIWHTDIPSANLESGPRPVAWEGVAVDAFECPVTPPRVWVAWRNPMNSGIVWRLDGTNGFILDEVEIPNWGTGGQRPYGGAVNSAGDFWLTGLDEQSRAVRVDAVTLQWEDVHKNPARRIYGMAVDQHGDVWGGSTSNQGAYHYAVATDTWSFVQTPNVGRLRGIQVDRDGFAWAAANDPCGLVKIDASTDTLVNDQIDLPGCSDPVGVSIDKDGFVWVVDRAANRAYKVHPDTFAIELTVDGLNEPYTYSDMTGAGLNLVIDPPG